MFTSLEKIIVQVNGMTCLWVNIISKNVNTHVIIQKDLRLWSNKLTIIISMVVSQFLWRVLRLINLTNWGHQLYPWHNFILVYHIKVVAINYIFSLIWICYGPKQDIMDYCGTKIFCLLSYYILSKDTGL